jgi:hypothetical protein
MSLVKAVEHSNLEEVDRILREQPSAAGAMDQKGWTPAHYAAMWGCLPALKRLYECGPSTLSTTVSATGDNSAHMAARFAKANQAVLQWIWKINPKLLTVPNHNGKTAISFIGEALATSKKGAEEWLDELLKVTSTCITDLCYSKFLRVSPSSTYAGYDIQPVGTIQKCILQWSVEN